MIQNSVLALTITALLALWGMPSLREGIFERVKRLPQWAQPLPPLVLAGAAALAQGYMDGVRGDALLERGASQAGEVGVLAIGAWHVWKRWNPLLVKLWPSAKKRPSVPVVLLCALTLGPLTACSNETKKVASPTTIELATATVNATDAALTVYIETAPTTVKSDEIQPLVDKLTAAATVVRSKGDLCDAVALLAPLAEQLKCAQCAALAATMRGELECP